MSTDKLDRFTPSTIVGIFTIVSVSVWLLDAVLNRAFTVVGFVYFIASFILAFLWRTQVADKSDFLLDLCKKILIGVGTSCILALFAIVFNRPIGDFILSRYIEGKTIGEVRLLQAEEKHVQVIQMTDEPIIKDYSPYARDKLLEIRRISEDAVKSGDTQRNSPR